VEATLQRLAEGFRRTITDIDHRIRDGIHHKEQNQAGRAAQK
jgi:hypothetical protein